MVALAECGTHAFVAAEVDAYSVGEKTLAQRLYPRLRADELLTADRGFYSWQAWDAAAATGAALLWRAPTQLDLPVVRVLPDGTYLTVLIKPTIRGRRRERLLAAAHAGTDLTDINAVPDAFDERGLPVIHLARVIEYDVPDRVGNGTGELIVLLSTITDLGGDNGPGPTSWPPPTISAGSRRPQRPAQDPPARPRPGAALAAARPGASGDLGLPDRPSRDQRADRPSLRRRRPRPGPDLLRPGPAPDPPHRHRDGGHSPLRTGLTAPGPPGPDRLLLIPDRRERTCPRAVKRARHNSYRVKKPGEPASTRHRAPATINLRATATDSMINLGYVALSTGWSRTLPLDRYRAPASARRPARRHPPPARTPCGRVS